MGGIGFRVAHRHGAAGQAVRAGRILERVRRSPGGRSRWLAAAAGSELPTREEVLADLLAAVRAVPETGEYAGPMLYRAAVAGPEAVALLRKRYRDQLMLLAAIDLAATVENEPVLPYQTVGRHLPIWPMRR